mmetsp:Transcript_115623/g.204862  ORF Transcript_115623/g.204862 Transcript_115623/m.204862 type:complete len:293 (+) Transcript_115623:654-1532(+)
MGFPLDMGREKSLAGGIGCRTLLLELCRACSAKLLGMPSSGGRSRVRRSPSPRRALAAKSGLRVRGRLKPPRRAVRSASVHCAATVKGCPVCGGDDCNSNSRSINGDAGPTAGAAPPGMPSVFTVGTPLGIVKLVAGGAAAAPAAELCRRRCGSLISRVCGRPAGCGLLCASRGRAAEASPTVKLPSSCDVALAVPGHSAFLAPPCPAPCVVEPPPTAPVGPVKDACTMPPGAVGATEVGPLSTYDLEPSLPLLRPRVEVPNDIPSTHCLLGRGGTSRCTEGSAPRDAQHAW